MNAPRIALVGGQWGQNVGNAFFNLGGREVLGQVFGPGSTGFIQDQPNYRTLHHKMRGNPRTYLDFVRRLEIDWLVLQGPVLNAWMDISWRATFEALRARGVRIMLLSAAFFKFRPSELAAVRRFLEDHPPDLISTRDSRSFSILSDWRLPCPLHDGIDSGFFLPEAVTPFAKRPGDYLALTFDRYPEPELRDGPRGGRHVERQITLLGERAWLTTPRWLDRAAHRSKIRAYMADLFDRRRLPSRFRGHDIVRTEHRFYPHVTHKIYRQPNATASDEPWTYAHIYAGARATLSDRVHACVAALAYGHPAMLFTPSPRAALFERLGLGEIRNGPVTLPPERLQEAKARQIAWLREAV